MGDAQSAQRQDKEDAAAAAEEESGKVDDARTQQDIDDKPLKNNGQITEINGKADGPKAKANGQCVDEIVADAVLSPGKDVSKKENPPKEEETTLLKNVENNEKMSTIEDVPLDMIELNAKQNDINEGFRRFFRNIGVKLTVKRGSNEEATRELDETIMEEQNRPEDDSDTTSKEAGLSTDVNKAPESQDNDSTTCPTLTDATSEDILEKEETAKAPEEAESNNAEAETGGEDAHQDASSPSSPEEEVVMSPIKRFFTTGIFSGIRKKKKAADDEMTEKELVDMEKKEVTVEAMEPTVEDQQQDKEETSPSVDAAVAEAEHKKNDLKEEILSIPSAPTSDEGKSSSTDPSVITVIESHVLSSQEKDKVQASPLKKLLSGSSFKKLPRKQRSRRSSDAKLSDSGEHVPDQLLSSTESAENQKEEGPPQPSVEAAGEEEGAWASFIKLLTPKKRMKRSSLSHEETQIPISEEEPKPSDGEQISDQSTEEGKKRKDSAVSWEAVLCGSGRRRSRKTSDSEEDETPIKNDQKPDDISKHVEDSPKDSCNENVNENENDIIASSQKQTESPSEDEGTLTWKSLKKLLTPKRRAKNEDEIKDNIQPDSEVTLDESSFSIKKLLPGRKKRKSAEKQDQISSDEADKDVASGDEDSETPAVVPLSEFDTVETEVNMQTQADIESHTPEEADSELQQDLLEQIAEPVPPCDSLHTEAKKVQENDSSEKLVSATPAKNEGPDDLTESVSKHQQLSDIPEEGIITETLATPASVAEEAAKDDTIAEDLIEITSEAITAPEPASDITIADETEMVSAVSQLSSESSKTSGNATPVPVESDIVDTDRLLNQVVETISVSPEAIPVCTDELSPEKIIGSVSQQTSETLKEEPTIPEIHTRLDETAINTGLNVDELAATYQTESISEVIDSVSTEVVSEIPTEEFDTAEMAPDEIRSNVTHAEESLKELDSITESHPFMECLSEINSSVSTDLLLEDEKVVPDVDSLVDAHQADTEPLTTDLQDADLAGTAEDDIKDEAMEQRVQIETEKDNITDQIQAEEKDQAPAELEKLQELAVVQATTLDSQEGSVQVQEEDVKSAAETFEPKKDELPLTEVCVEQDKENELKTDAAKTEHDPEPEASEAVPASTIDSEKSGVQVPEKDIDSEDISPEETAADEPKQTADDFTDVGFEPECKELSVSVNKTEQVEELEVIHAIQAPTVDSEEGSVQSTETEVKSEDISPAETIAEAVPAFPIDSAEGSAQMLEEGVKAEDISPLETVSEEPKKTAEHLTDVSLEPEEEVAPVNAVKTELDSGEGSIQSTEENVKSQDIPPGEPLVGEDNQTTVHLTKVRVEPDNKELQVDAIKTEPVQELEVIDAVPAPTVDSEEGDVQSTEEEVLSAETVTEEPKQPAEHIIDVNFEQKPEEPPVVALKTEHVQGLDVVEAVPAPTLDSEEGGVQSTEEEIKLKDIPPGEPLTGEDDQTTEHLIKVCIEPDNKELRVDAIKTEPVQEQEVIEVIPTPTIDSEKSGVQMPEGDVTSEDISPAETVSEEPKKAAEDLTDVSLEPEIKELQVITIKTEPVQEAEVKEAVPEPSLDSEEGNVPAPKEKVTPEDIPSAETATLNLKEEILPLTEVSVTPEKENELETDAAKTDHGQIPETSEDVPAPTTNSEEGSVQSTKEEVKAEDISPAETVTEEPKQTAEHLSDVRFEPEDKELPGNAVQTEQVEEKEVIETVPVLPTNSEEGSVQSTKEEVKAEDISPAETVTEEPKQTTEHLNDVKFEPEDKELPGNAVQTEQVEEKEVIETVPVLPIDSEEGSVQMPQEDVKSEDISPEKTVLEEPKKTAEHLSDVRFEPEDKELPGNAVQTEQVEEKEVIETVPVLPIDSEEGSVQMPQEDVKSEDISPEKTVLEEPKKTADHLSDVKFEPEDKELPGNAVQTEQVEEKEVIETAPVLPIDSEEGSVQMPQEDVKSEDISPEKTVLEEPKKTAEHLSDVSLEPEEDVPLLNAVKTEPVQEPEVIEAAPAPTLDSEVSCVQSLEKEILIEDVPKTQTVTDELKEDTTHLTEVNLETVDSSKPEPVQEQEVKEIHAVQTAELEPEVDNILSPENKVKSEEVPAVEIVTAQPKQETDLRVETDDKQTVEAAQTEPVQEPEVLPSNVEDTVTETESKEDDLMHVPVVTESIERSVTQELEKTILSDNILKPDTTSVTTSVADKTETEASAQQGEALEITEDQKSESVPQDVQIEQRDGIPEAVDELQTLTELHTPSVNEEASNGQVQQTVLSEETSTQCMDNVVSTDEPKHEINLSAVQVHGELEKESEHPGTEIKTAAGEHAVGAQVVVCNLKDVLDPIPDILIEKTSEITEPLIETMANELVFREESEAAAPLVKDFVTETAEEGSEIVLKHVPSVTSEEDPRIQAQVVDVDTKSAETTVESMLEVGMVETKEVLDACQETVEKVANFTLIPEIEDELITEETKVTIQEVTQHVLENLQETVPESLVVNLEKEVTEQQDEVAKVSEMVESVSNDVQDQKAVDDSTGPFRERQDEAPAVISDDSAADRPLTEDSIQECHVPGLLDVTINDHKEDLEKTKAEQEKPEESVTAEEVKSSSAELDKEKNHEQARVTQISQSPTGTPSNAVSQIPQNTGIISSRGNLESPSSLSLELKLNIQFGQVKTPISLSPTTERSASEKLTEDASEFRVEVVEAQSQIQPELTKAAFKSTEITEPVTTTAIIITQPILLDVGIQAETVEPVEQINATEKVTPTNQSTGSIEPVQPTEKTEVSLSQPVLVKACVQETKSEAPAQTEKENDQDVWTDAEEVIHTQEETKVSILEVEEPQAPQTESEEQQQKAGPEREVETTSESKNEEKESQQEVQNTERECEFESEGEVFAIAVEQLETATMIVTVD